MQCRNCGAEIADKALICYRCGTATSEAKYQPAPVRRRRSRAPLAITVLVIAILLLLFILYLRYSRAGHARLEPARDAFPAAELPPRRRTIDRKGRNARKALAALHIAREPRVRSATGRRPRPRLLCELCGQFWSSSHRSQNLRFRFQLLTGDGDGIIGEYVRSERPAGDCGAPRSGAGGAPGDRAVAHLGGDCLECRVRSGDRFSRPPLCPCG